MVLSRRGFVVGAAVALLSSPVLAQTPPRTRAWRAASATEPARAPYDFNAVGTTSDRPVAGARVRVSADGLAWSDWHAITAHEAHGERPYHGDLLIVPPSRYAECDRSDVQLHLIDSAPGPSTRAGLASVSIIPRSGWGCDERLGYDASGSDLWPPEPIVPVKVIVHHTVTSNSEPDPAATVRAVHHYHASTLGWGDVGYHYLVDRFGNVYEGRKGGTHVRAGHALQYNRDSIGIACLGTFTSGGTAVSTAMRQSLARLIAQVAPAIDPHDTGWHVDRSLANLCGHRDTGLSACPGDALYALLPALRGDVLYNLGARPSPRASIVGFELSPSQVAPGGVATVRVTVQNTGSATLNTQDPTDVLLYDERDTYSGRGFGSRDAAWRLGLDLSGGGASGGLPFRWGLPQSLEPGVRTTIVGQIRLASAGSRTASAQMIWEGRQTSSSGPVQAGLTVVAATPTPVPTPTATPVPVRVSDPPTGYVRRARFPLVSARAGP